MSSGVDGTVRRKLRRTGRILRDPISNGGFGSGARPVEVKGTGLRPGDARGEL